MVEQLTLNQWAVGSIPSGDTNKCFCFCAKDFPFMGKG